MVAAGVSATYHAFLLTTIYHFAVFTAEQEECPENVSFDVHLWQYSLHNKLDQLCMSFDQYLTKVCT